MFQDIKLCSVGVEEAVGFKTWLIDIFHQIDILNYKNQIMWNQLKTFRNCFFHNLKITAPFPQSDSLDGWAEPKSSLDYVTVRTTQDVTRPASQIKKQQQQLQSDSSGSVSGWLQPVGSAGVILQHQHRTSTSCFGSVQGGDRLQGFGAWVKSILSHRGINSWKHRAHAFVQHTLFVDKVFLYFWLICLIFASTFKNIFKRFWPAWIFEKLFRFQLDFKFHTFIKSFLKFPFVYFKQALSSP